MRTLLLLSVVCAVAACADQQTTSPSSPSSPSGASRANGLAPASSALGTQAPVKGFKQVIYVDTTVLVQPYTDQDVDVFCPLGTVAIGGGYAVNTNAAVLDTRILQSRPFGSTKYRVEVSVSAAAPVPAIITVTGACIE